MNELGHFKDDMIKSFDSKMNNFSTIKSDID